MSRDRLLTLCLTDNETSANETTSKVEDEGGKDSHDKKTKDVKGKGRETSSTEKPIDVDDEGSQTARQEKTTNVEDKGLGNSGPAKSTDKDNDPQPGGAKSEKTISNNEEKMSDYERTKKKNIEKNNELLLSLGLAGGAKKTLSVDKEKNTIEGRKKKSPKQAEVGERRTSQRLQ